MNNGEQPAQKGGMPAFCNILGTLILVAVVLFCVPLSMPRLFGYEIYSVVSGSMEPALPVGSLVYVEQIAPEQVETGDIIAYVSGGDVITHRVTVNRMVEGEFVTKGDANEQEDMTTVPYRSLIGRVAYHIPMMGSFTFLYTSMVGKLYVIGFAFCGVLLNILAGQLRARRREQAFMRQLEVRELRLREKKGRRL